MRARLDVCLAVCLLTSFSASLSAAPADARLEKATTLNDYHPFTPPSSVEEWTRRARRVREQILVAAGLWPMPPKAPLDPVVHGKIERDAYSVEKVFFQSWPGFYVTGNLYRPKGASGSGRRPAVLSPHGHWASGRFYERPKADAQTQIEQKKERTLAGARYPLQARCAMLARLGCVVFHYDMVGYADSRQIEHRYAFGDIDAELRLQNMFGLQLYNSIRALDFLAGLPDVDPERIGVTGASGGGTQTFFLTAVDPRPRAAFPAVMVSTAMQGGCTCENATLLRVNTGNVEFAALAAPRPLGMTGANDWTIEIETKGLPELTKLYRMLGAPEKVTARCFPGFEHNYNQVSREVMYNWFNEHLELGAPEPVREAPFEPIPPKELSVFDEEHRLPDDAVNAPRLRDRMTFISERLMADLAPDDGPSLARYRRVVSGALRAVINSELPASGEVEAEQTAARVVEGHQVNWLVLSRKGTGEAVPALWIVPERWTGKVVVALSGGGKGDYSTAEGSGHLQDLGVAVLTRDAALLIPDVLLTGETAPEDGRARLPVDTDRHERFCGYTYGYNRTLMAQRIHDVLTAIGYARAQAATHSVYLLGANDGGLWALLAKGLAGEAVQGVAAESPGFRFGDLENVGDPRFLPGALKYGGWAGFASLCAPGRLLLAGDGESANIPNILSRAYSAAGASGHFAARSGPLSGATVEELLGF